MKNIILALLLNFLLLLLSSCADNTPDDECIRPTGNYIFSFREISGDCGNISDSIIDISDPIMCVGSIDWNDNFCTLDITDECMDSYEEVMLSVVDGEIIGSYDLYTTTCEGSYQLIAK